MKGFSSIDFIVLIVYLIGVLLIGLYFSKKDMEGKEYFKGDGTIPWWVTSVSIFATLLSPISFLSLAGNSYSGTWALWFAQLGIFIAIPLTIRFFLPVFSKLKIDTAYHYLEIRYKSKGLRVIGAIIFIIYQIGRMSIIMYLPSIVLARLSNIHVNIFIILMGIIAIIYSYTGGIKSVLWTDFIQGVVLIVGVVGTLVFIGLKVNGGFPEIFNTLFEQGKFLSSNEVIFDPNILKTSIFMILVGGGLNTFSSYISSQDVVQRFTTTTDIKQLNRMTYTNGILSIVVATLFYLIGTALFVFYRQNPELLMTAQQDQIYASFIAYQLPAGVTGILLAAIYAASQSTLSTGLNSVATSWTLDIQNFITKDLSFKKQTKIAQLISLLVGIISIVVSIILASSEIKSAYEWFNGFIGAVLGVLAGIFVLGVVYKKATKLGAYVGFIVATIVVLALKYKLLNVDVSIWAYSLITIVVTVVVGIIVSLFSKEKNEYNTN
ncbi:sodium:solute symporter [Candidatus Arthromitus sp. SFB-turkey]|uniref:sodium:solute symporter n=1 Tax=Candidatus Arthromitus sp. SFB-turkey TaxID=1840217 RepID=UPI0007F53F1F|nr:sodium:solute symporter [Candidatus Arthromitus sp. SFB-turkey]OAT86957.1 sodium:solute symporter [Candidatus Arthromitus sp. SFB-turkey]HJD00788.1 sodium:solute symporter [Candidatus Dwaynia gallinarum]